MCDSHDNMEAIAKAVEFFNQEGVDLVLHAGDLVSPFTVEAFKKLDCDFKAVYGNNEGDIPNLNKKLEELSTELAELLELTYDEKEIVVYHGHNPTILEAFVESGGYDIVITGHTHTPEITLDGDTMVVNPGETCGYLTGVRTVALLDPKEMKADIHNI